jgi:glycerophosphoryl diester phosphodiesterase
MRRPLPFAGFHIQGHRGARGVVPENSIESCCKAVELGAQGLEIDVVVSKDSQLVVNHDPFFKENSYLINIFKTNYADIREYTFGQNGHPKFKKQQPMACFRPTLSELIEAIFNYCDSKHIKRPFFNIEIKSHPKWYGHYVPYPSEFVALLKHPLSYLPLGSYYFSSFDPLILREIRRQVPDIPLAFLTENRLELHENLQNLGFLPEIYSPYFKFLNKKTISQAHRLAVKVVTWTVNEKQAAKRLKEWGVDGIITDYPYQKESE